MRIETERGSIVVLVNRDGVEVCNSVSIPGERTKDFGEALVEERIQQEYELDTQGYHEKLWREIGSYYVSGGPEICVKFLESWNEANELHENGILKERSQQEELRIVSLLHVLKYGGHVQVDTNAVYLTTLLRTHVFTRADKDTVVHIVHGNDMFQQVNIIDVPTFLKKHLWVV